MEPILTLDHLSYAYHTLEGETKALSDISLSVKPGEFVAIVGPSGCGKSTLLSLIAGLLKPEEGEILLNGKSLKESATNIGYMLQHDHLFEWRTIYHNILLGLEIQHTLTAAAKTHARELLKTYGLEKFADSRPSELSGGMRQRAALIRTLILEPDLLLLDEPVTGLDPLVTEELYQLIEQLNRDLGVTIIMVSHDISSATQYADKILHISQSLLFYGDTESYINTELGKRFLKCS